MRRALSIALFVAATLARPALGEPLTSDDFRAVLSEAERLYRAGDQAAAQAAFTRAAGLAEEKRNSQGALAGYECAAAIAVERSADASILLRRARTQAEATSDALAGDHLQALQAREDKRLAALAPPPPPPAPPAPPPRAPAPASRSSDDDDTPYRRRSYEDRADLRWQVRGFSLTPSESASSTRTVTPDSRLGFLAGFERRMATDDEGGFEWTGNYKAFAGAQQGSGFAFDAWAAGGLAMDYEPLRLEMLVGIGGDGIGTSDPGPKEFQMVPGLYYGLQLRARLRILRFAIIGSWVIAHRTPDGPESERRLGVTVQWAFQSVLLLGGVESWSLAGSSDSVKPKGSFDATVGTVGIGF